MSALHFKAAGADGALCGRAPNYAHTVSGPGAEADVTCKWCLRKLPIQPSIDLMAALKAALAIRKQK